MHVKATDYNNSWGMVRGAITPRVSYEQPNVGQPATREHAPCNTAFLQCFLLPPTAAHTHTPSSHSSGLAEVGLSSHTQQLLNFKAATAEPTLTTFRRTAVVVENWNKVPTAEIPPETCSQHYPGQKSRKGLGLNLNGAPVPQVGGMTGSQMGLIRVLRLIGA